MASKLRVDSILPVDGAPTSGGGGVIQVVSATKTDTQSISGTGSSADITGLSVSITPTRSDSKILFTCNLTVGNSGSAGYLQGFMVRDSTNLLVGTHGTGNMVNCTFANSGTGSSYYVEAVTFSVLDSPNSTSELTYKVQLGKGDNSYQLYINRPGTLDNNTYNSCASSTLTVMEVSA